MLHRLHLGLAILVLLSASALTAQEVAFLDLVDVKPRIELRSPPLPPVCKQDGSCTVSGGSFGSIACGAVGLGEPRALKTTLVSLDRFAYAPGDTPEVEIKIENVGSVDIAIPWSPHLADLQPVDETRSFHYLSIALSLELTSQRDKGKKEIIEAAKLYGAVENPATLTVLTPGQWVRLRVKAKLAVSSENADYSANAIPELRSEIFIPNVKNGGYGTDIANDYPRRLYGPALMLRITQESPQ